MRRLAAVGGVMQVTLYNGFLKAAGEATILDAIAHLEHAVHVMGIDHVGLGTDFDGDGGICGLRDSSELLQFTRQLLSRRYTERDIQKIWGGNFLRVMALVQKGRQGIIEAPYRIITILSFFFLSFPDFPKSMYMKPFLIAVAVLLMTSCNIPRRATETSGNGCRARRPDIRG